MHLQLISPASDDEVLSGGANERFVLEDICSLLKQAAERGHTYEIVDSSTISDEHLHERYLEVAARAPALRIQVSQMFGSRTVSGTWGFGTKVPALVVYSNMEMNDLISVYPHVTNADGLTTIRWFLESLLRA